MTENMQQDVQTVSKRDLFRGSLDKTKAKYNVGVLTLKKTRKGNRKQFSIRFVILIYGKGYNFHKMNRADICNSRKTGNRIYLFPWCRAYPLSLGCEVCR